MEREGGKGGSKYGGKSKPEAKSKLELRKVSERSSALLSQGDLFGSDGSGLWWLWGRVSQWFRLWATAQKVMSSCPSTAKLPLLGH